MPPPICQTSCGATPASATAAALEALFFVAGEVQFGSLTTPEAFVFTEVAGESHPITFAGIVLDPSSNSFDSPAPGTLRYIGTTPLRALVSYGMTFLLIEGAGSAPVIMLASLMLNGETLPETFQGSVEDADADNAFSASVSTMLTLQPGDELQVGIATLTPSTYTIAFTALNIVANRI